MRMIIEWTILAWLITNFGWYTIPLIMGYGLIHWYIKAIVWSFKD